MAHKTQKDKEIMINTDAVPQDYVATLCFFVKGNHLLDVHVTEEHLDQLVMKIHEFKQQRLTAS